MGRELSANNILKMLGGFSKVYSEGRIDYYTLMNHELVVMKGSRLYDDGVSYWYGITPNAIDQYKKNMVTHYIFGLGYEGLIKLPIDILYDYIVDANTSKNTIGNIKHFHIRIRFSGSDIILYNKHNQWILNSYYYNERVTELIPEEFASKSIDVLLEEAKQFTVYEKQYTESEKKCKQRIESKAQKERIAFIENHRCQVCGFREEYINKSGKKSWIIEIDHIKPKSEGGTEVYDNLWALCPNCHSKKTAGIIIVDPSKKIVLERNEVIQIIDNHLKWNG